MAEIALEHLTLSALVKLASAAVHYDEYTSARGHSFDLSAAATNLADPEVAALLEEMRALALIPEKR